jgi:hypothetical protein
LQGSLRWLGVAAILVSLAVRFVHLDADFPNHTFWHDDHAKFSDEGWYANAAMNSVLYGHWYVPGDWAPAVVVPAWPALLTAEFHFTGISVVAARATEAVFFCLALLLCGVLFRKYYSSDATLALVFLAAVNTCGYIFSRVAILEEPLVFVTLAAILVALAVKRSSVLAAMVLGALLVLMVLTKTTGAFLVPAVLYPIWFHHRQDWRKAVRPLAIVLLTAVLLMAAERLLFASHYAADAHAFFAESKPRLQLFATARKGVRAILRGTWIDPILWPVACAGLLASLWLRDLWKQVLWGVCALWTVGYLAFIVYHFDGPPRYFTAMILPTMMLVVMFAVELRKRHPASAGLVIALCVASAGWNAWHVQKYVRHPEYTMLHASQQVAEIINAHPDVPRLMFGHAANETTLFNHIPSMDDGFGTLPLAQKAATYHPGWILIWSDEPVSALDPLAGTDKLVPMASLPVYDDAIRNHLLLFQLVPLNPGNAGSH